MASASTSIERKDKKVILFGRTSGGKSTIANVLVAGGLQPVIFVSSDAPSGCTSATQKESGRGWIVTDTVGLGEADLGTTSHIANNMVIEFFKEVRDEYSHIIYVRKAGRFIAMEEMIWSLFAKIFEGAEDAFVILITGAGSEWLEANWDQFPEYWKQHNILATDIPPINKRPTIERRLRVIRERSIAQLEKDLEKLFEDRRNQYFTPAIARMNAEQLEKKFVSVSVSLSLVKRLSISWQKATSKLSSLFKITGTLTEKKKSRVPMAAVVLKDDIKQVHGVGKTRPIQHNTNDEVWDDTQNKLATSFEGQLSGQLVNDQGLLYKEILLEGQLKSDWGVLETDMGSVPETAPHPSRAFFVEAFVREVNEGNEDGYFVSSKWLLSLVDNERDSLMSCLRTAGYSETCQTTTTTLFARIDNNTSRKTAAEFVWPGDIDEVTAPEGGDDQFDIDLNTEKFVARADVVGSNNPVERSSSIDHGRNLVNSSPVERQAAVLESFKATLKSRSQQSFCVSMKWLSNLEDHDKETLLTQLREAGYEKISQTTSATWYKRIQDCAGNQGGGACDTFMSSSSNRNGVSSNEVQQSTISGLLGIFKRMVDPGDDASGSSHETMAIGTNEIQDDDCACHAQILTVACSSSTRQTPGELVQDGSFYRQEFGGSVGKWPVSKSEDISATIEKSFRIPTLDFLTNEGGTEVPTEVFMNLQAFATISLSCCLRIGHQPPKIRLKFSRISAEIKNKETEEENEELQQEFCNNVVLSYLCTNVYSCIDRTDSGDSGCGSRPIILHLEDEYNNPPGMRVLANDENSWLEKSGITPMNCEPGSTSVALRCDIEKCSLHNLGIPRPLHFQETRPLILEGNLNTTLPLEFCVEFHIRHKLAVSYFKPSRPILEPGPVWIANNSSNDIDFRCCLKIRTDNILPGSVSRSFPAFPIRQEQR